VTAQLHFARFTDMAANPGSGRDFTSSQPSDFEQPSSPGDGGWNE
jgi:replicative DNA helicase